MRLGPVRSKNVRLGQTKLVIAYYPWWPPNRTSATLFDIVVEIFDKCMLDFLLYMKLSPVYPVRLD